MFNFFKKFFEPRPLEYRPLSVNTKERPLEFRQSYIGPCAERINTSQMKILAEWELEAYEDLDPTKARIGELGDLVIVQGYIVPWKLWANKFVIEKRNVPVLIKIFKDAYKDIWNHGAASTLESCAPDYIEVFVGVRSLGSIMVVRNHRDIELDGKRSGGIFDDFIFPVQNTRTFLAELEKIAATLPGSSEQTTH